jgi:cytochrome P450
VIIYRLTLHPLARYPGPLLAKITDWYNVYHAWKGDRHLELFRIHKLYGDVVRFGPNSISINTHTALRDIYGFKANVKKSDFYSVFPATKAAFSTHTAIDKAVHARKRRVLSQAFSDSAMRAMEVHIVDNIQAWCGHLGDNAANSKDHVNLPMNGFGGLNPAFELKGWSAPKNMGDWANYLSFDVLGDLCFGKPFGVMEREENRFVLDLISTAAYFHNVNGQMPMIKKLGLDALLFGKIKKRRERYMTYSKQQMAERAKLGIDGQRRDFFHYLLTAKDPETGKGFGPQELWGESNVLLIAGKSTQLFNMKPLRSSNNAP